MLTVWSPSLVTLITTSACLVGLSCAGRASEEVAADCPFTVAASDTAPVAPAAVANPTAEMVPTSNGRARPAQRLVAGRGTLRTTGPPLSPVPRRPCSGGRPAPAGATAGAPGLALRSARPPGRPAGRPRPPPPRR